MWFDSAAQLGRVAVAGAVSYVALLVVLRTSGKRTLSKLNAFDVVVSVALGSTLASAIVSTDVSIVEAIAAFVVLALAQLAVAWTSVRARAIRRLVKPGPSRHRAWRSAPGSPRDRDSGAAW